MIQEQQISIAETRELFEAYSAAWAHHDLEAIMAHHHPAGAVRLYRPGQEERTGLSEIRERWQNTLSTWPDIDFETVRVEVAPGIVVHEVMVRATLGVDLETDGGTLPADGRGIAVEGVDILTWKDRLVLRKDTYLDSEKLMRQLATGHRNS